MWWGHSQLADVDPFVFEEGFNLLCGDKLGEGVARTVFACKFDEALVVKVEKDPYQFQNAAEWRIWQECQYYRKAADWLAPCVAISPRGSIMLQRRVDPAPAHLLPAMLPAFIRDVKPSHFGFYQGRLVCCDYALTDSTLPMKLKKADW